ncbi:MAG TPA: hypothetical protein VGB96_16015, partial [Archangium sp.]
MNTSWWKSCLLLHLTVMVACGDTGLSDAPPSPELAQSEEALTGTASTCGPSQISWDANPAGTPSWENGRCAGPWQYSEYSLPCYKSMESSACGIKSTNYTTCTRNLSCRHPDFGLDYRTNQPFSTQVSPVRTRTRICDPDPDLGCYDGYVDDYNMPCRDQAVRHINLIDYRYRSSVTQSNFVSNINTSSRTATCNYTLYNYPTYVYAQGAQCGTEQFTCINEADPYEYYTCRNSIHGDDTPGACGFVPGRKYSPPGMTLNEVKQLVSSLVVTEQTSAYDPSGTHKALCTTGDELP